MILKSQKRIAAQVLKVGINKVWLDPERIDDIKEAITKADIRSLIKSGVIKAHKLKTNSRARFRKRLEQKRKGRSHGLGSRKGTKNARLSSKREWINKIRVQRELIKTLSDKGLISHESYYKLRSKSKGGFFRNKRHLQLYLTENNLIIKNGNK
ncbi:MAG TPA: 50S ribosomal protein L19e [Candidatus Nanoarchaeia archaeon]|nr:hypothetical protein [uncultured archaeon]AQS34181.1 hypothetical protein [uncultured archaeon]HLC56559.1 50S ribosomal protein L19e [Candidatus Nanoarchaeia archaeon]